jgi:Family of unknown function (DUF6069)
MRPTCQDNDPHTMHTETITTQAPTHTTIRRALTVATATAAALITWALADPIAGQHLKVHLNGSAQPISAAAVIATGLLAGLAAWALLALLERTRKQHLWTRVTLIVLAVSLTGPLANGIGTPSKLTLTSLHLIVAAILILPLRPKPPTD